MILDEGMRQATDALRSALAIVCFTTCSASGAPAGMEHPDADRQDANSGTDGSRQSTLPEACAALCKVEVKFPACFPPSACGDCLEACESQCESGGGLAGGPCGGLYLDYARCASGGVVTGCTSDGVLEVSGCDTEFAAVVACTMSEDAGGGVGS